MDVSLFYQLPAWPEQTPGQRYEDTLRQIELGDHLGFPVAWLAELHFEPNYGVMPSPFLIAAAAAQRTTHIGIGTAVTILPLHDPLRLAEEVATLDHLTNGRLRLGIGRGGIQQHYAGYGVPLAHRQSRFDEALQVLQRSWAPGPMSFAGEHFAYDDVNVVPKPLQQPHPPLSMAANSDESIETALALQLPVMLAIMTASPQQLRDRSAHYRAARPGAPDTDISMLVPIHVAESDELARADTERSYLSYLRQVARVFRDGAARAPAADAAQRPHLPQLAQRFEEMTYDDAAEQIAAVSNPDRVAARLRDIAGTYHCGSIMGWFNFGGRVPHERVLASMHLFADQVRPMLT